MNDWLEKKDAVENVKQEGGIESHNLTIYLLEKLQNMKRMEQELVKDVTNKLQEKKKKLSTEEPLKLAAVGTKKITGWLVKTSVEWDDDPDIPELEEIDVIEQREATKAENRAMASELMEEMFLTAVRKGMLEMNWRLLQEDP